jgi:superfamily II DNA or RNA helicase
MTSFENFISSLNSDPLKKGKQFEVFIKWFLKNDPEWSTQISQVWLWDEYPQSWGRDCGIDLVFQHKNGENWAVQAKCYSPEYSITKHDVDKFLSESNRPAIKKRLLIATTDLISGNARQVCDAQDKQVVKFLLSHFENSDINYPTSIKDLYTVKPKNKPKPRNHQIEAIKSVTEKFKDVDFGQLIMACGTGKTYTTLWIKEALMSNSTLVLVPSLGLLSQTLHEWTFAAKDLFDVLCVCSDETVGKKVNDENISTISDLAFPVTSSKNEIKKFLLSDSPKVIFATYQSSQLIEDIQTDLKIDEFDLVIADEAHRCTGKVKSNFSRILNPNAIRSKKKLFATATPKTYSTAIKKSAQQRGVEIVGMDDEEQFGPVLYRLSFSKAIKLELLSDYRIVVIGVDNKMIADSIKRRDILHLNSGFEIDSKSLASYIGLLKAIKEFNLQKIISFHSRVNKAKEFSQILNYVNDSLSKKSKPEGELSCDFVSGDMPTSQRRLKLEHLKNIKSDQRALLANARCLSEGVDVPSLDGVAFIEPKQSQVDIIQAVGRAIRLSENKTLGTIIIPVFIESGMNADEVLSGSEFKPVWDVLNALKSQDDDICLELDQIRFELGLLGQKKAPRLPHQITLDIPSTVDKDFERSLRTYLIENTTDSWDFMFGVLVKYTNKNGTSRIPSSATFEGYNLGNWVQTQRNNSKHMDERRNKLESLKDWSWDPYEEQWSLNFLALKKFAEVHGNCIVPPSFNLEESKNLNNWVKIQRQNKDLLTEERTRNLEKLKGWVWGVNDYKWEQGINHLKKYLEINGTANVPIKYVDKKSGFRLGNWVGAKRAIKDQLSKERIVELESFHGWLWDSLKSSWDIGFGYLMEYINNGGDPKIPKGFVNENGIKLGQWVLGQRKNYKKLSKERVQKLESIDGWSWDPFESLWEEGYEYLLKYVESFGNALVPATYVSDEGFTLGRWVASQRNKRNNLSIDKVEKLEVLSNWLWDPYTVSWEESFKALEEYSKNYGNCNVPEDYLSLDNKNLYHFVNDQRKHKKSGKLSKYRQEKLMKLQGWSWNPNEDKWNNAILLLNDFVNKNGDSDVPVDFITKDGFKLGSWCSTRRKDKHKLTPEKINQLECLPGWTWNKLDSQWNESYEKYIKYIDEFGSKDIPVTFKDPTGYNLGLWVSNQRKKRLKLSDQQINKLTSIPKWRWDDDSIVSKQERLDL